MTARWSRETAIDQVRPIVWRYLKESAVLRRSLPNRGSLEVDLLPDDLQRLAASHLAMSSLIWTVISSCRDLLRLMPASVERHYETSSAHVRGKVDWRKTVNSRVVSSDPTLFVSERVDRRYDTSLGRTVKAALNGLDQLTLLSGFTLDAKEITESRENSSLGETLAHLKYEAQRMLRHPKLRQVRTVQATSLRHLDALSNRYPHTLPILQFLRMLNQVQTNDEVILETFLEDQILTPRKNEQLFELQVGLSLLNPCRS